MEEQLSLDFLRVVENAAIAAARTMGFGDRHHADEVAVEAMRKTMDSVEIDGTIVIGEGERDEAPMLYIGEKVGLATHAPKALFPQVDIAVDPLEGTNLCATGAANAIAVLAASERGGLLHAPDLYMEKLVVGPSCKGAVDLDAPVADNLKAIAKRLDRDVEDLVVIVLDRPRHEKLIEEIRTAGARIRLIGDRDLSAGISVSVVGTGVHAVMGTGGAPEGVLTAAALRCLNGQILARLVVSKPEHAERLTKMGVKDTKRIYDTEDLAPGKKMIFACTGVTDGNLLGIAAQCRTSRLRGDSGSIIRLERNPRGLWRAVRCADTRVADEHLAIAAVGAARRGFQLRGTLIRGMARSYSQKCDKAPRSADGRQNAFRSDQCSVRIGRNQMRRRLAGFSRASASIQQVDLPSLRRIFQEVRRSRAEGYIASISAHRRRAAIVVCRSAVSRCG